MKSQILFLTDNSTDDALAYCLLCYVAQTTKTPVTVVHAMDAGYHSKISAVFNSETTVRFVANISVAVSYLDSYELDQCDCMFANLHDLCRKMNIANDIEFAVTALSGGTLYYLPAALSEMLARRMGLIEFGNFVSQRIIENIRWDICRDAEVIDILDPPEAKNVSV